MRRILRQGKIQLALVTFVLIIVTGIIFKQSFIRMLPLCISLIVLLLNTTANRYAFLIGAANSVLYGFVFMGMKLYGTMFNSFLVSFPMQLISFFLWNKNSYGNSTVMKRLSNKMRVIVAFVAVTVWLILYVILLSMGSGHIILDNTSTILGLVAALLSMFAYIEAPFITLLGQPVSLIMHIQIMLTEPSQITYVIYSVYAFICTLTSFRYMCTLYRIQQGEKYEKHCRNR